MKNKYTGYALALAMVIFACVGAYFPQAFFRISFKDTKEVISQLNLDIFSKDGWIVTVREQGFYKYSLIYSITLIVSSFGVALFVITPLKQIVKTVGIRVMSIITLISSTLFMADAYRFGSSSFIHALRNDIEYGHVGKFGLGLGLYCVIITGVIALGMAIKPELYLDTNTID